MIVRIIVKLECCQLGSSHFPMARSPRDSVTECCQGLVCCWACISLAVMKLFSSQMSPVNHGHSLTPLVTVLPTQMTKTMES
ncbi:hypothetical protein BDV18DRAFT_146383 [Aspergillus unguis]